ncbi:MAG: glycosyltransferase family 9 protein [Xanthomonadales bacterium]|nr:glycosyltransferase family 9 protein [Xanthomonadales bacterium]
MDQSPTADPQPDSLCLLRTSAIGDVTHVVPLVRTLQARWPQTRLTWLVGKLEHRLVGDIEGIDFIIFDKRAGRAGYRAVREQLAGRRFDALLHMQVALRSNLLSLAVKAPLRIGYDRARSKDLHGLFINCRIKARRGDHVLDALGSFLEPLGLEQTRVRWDIPIPSAAREFAARHVRGNAPLLVVSPVSSHRLRNWAPERYAAVMDHAALGLGWQVILCGGPSAFEREFGDAILAHMKSSPLDLIGKDTLKELLALLERADLVLAPDSGPMHMANAVGTPVLGLHAASNPARSGPYSDRQWCVDRYDAAAHKYRKKPADALPWGTKLEHRGVMDLIGVDDVVERLEAFDAARGSLPRVAPPRQQKLAHPAGARSVVPERPRPV